MNQSDQQLFNGWLGTIFSNDRVYRYTLFRTWDEGLRFGDNVLPKGFAMWVCLNPSTADEFKNDPTVKRCLDYSRRWGYSSFVMTNLFAFRSTFPKDLPLQSDPVGPDNDKWLVQCAGAASIIILGYGKNGGLHDRADHVLKLLRPIQPLYCLSKNDDGSPEHPLYLRKELTPIPY